MSNFDVDAVLASSDESPVVMLNLVKFREASLDGDGSGRDAYRRYGDAAITEVEGRGGKVIWAGRVEECALAEGLEEHETDWDHALLVYYPSRAAFVDMVTNPDYLAANEHRVKGVEKHMIVATKSLLFDSMPGAS